MSGVSYCFYEPTGVVHHSPDEVVLSALAAQRNLERRAASGMCFAVEKNSLLREVGEERTFKRFQKQMKPR